MINTALFRFGGAVQVASSIIRECINFPEHDYHVVLGPAVARSIESGDFPHNFQFYEQAFGVIGIGNVHKVHRVMTTLENQVKPDCVLTTAGPAFWKSQAPHVMGFNRPLHIYPESPYVRALPELRKLRLEAQRQVHRWFYRREADAFIVQTDDVNQRVRDWLGTEEVHTITNTHSADFIDRLTFSPRLPTSEPGVFRFLTVTSYYPHKNLEIIPQVLAELRREGIDNVEFVLTITPDEYRARIGNTVPCGVHLVGPVPPRECPSLYAECHGMFLPTLAECFSASYPEAMVMRKPIVTTDLGFARSICGPAAMYFKPCDAEDAAHAITDLVADQTLRAQLAEEGGKRLGQFDSARERTRKVLSLCDKLANQPRGIAR